METPWLHVIGIGETGLDGLNPEALKVLSEAEIIIGGTRHHKSSLAFKGKKIQWPSPFTTMIEEIGQYRSRTTAVLVTGDPLWYSAGSKLAREWPSEEIRFYPQISAFQLSCARMQWSVPDVEKLTIHGRPPGQIIPFLAPGNRLVILTSDQTSPSIVAHILIQQGYGESGLTVLGELGGPNEIAIHGRADSWKSVEAENDIPNFHTLCVHCKPQAGVSILPAGPGLPDNAFATDGNFTKSEVRAVTVAALAPFRNKVLWDLGCGHGTVGIEWLRLSFEGEVYATEQNQGRCQMASLNAERLGVPKFRVFEGLNQDLVDQFPDPNAIFIGGGLDEQLVSSCIARLKPYGRLVVNSATLESEALLVNLQKQYGGELIKIAIARIKPIGSFSTWDQHIPVTQWRYER